MAKHRISQRTCKVIGCNINLKGMSVPKYTHITLCGYHQADLFELKEDFPLFKDFSEDDQEFIIKHLKGCNPETLLQWLNINKNLLINQQWILAPEIVKWIFRQHLCISVNKVAKEIGCDRKTLLKYLDLYLGIEVFHNLSGKLVIDRNKLPYLKENVPKIAAFFHRHPYYKFFETGEISVNQLANISKISTRQILTWIKRKLLKAQERKFPEAQKIKWIYAIKIKDLKKFIKLAKKYKVLVWERTRQKLLALDFSQPPFSRSP